MSEEVQDGQNLTRKGRMVTLSPEAAAYVEGKAPLFARGHRGGFSEALTRMVIFCKEYEIEQAGGSKQ